MKVTRLKLSFFFPQSQDRTVMDNNVNDMIMVKQWYGVMVQHVWFAMHPGKICCCEDFIVALI